MPASLVQTATVGATGLHDEEQARFANAMADMPGFMHVDPPEPEPVPEMPGEQLERLKAYYCLCEVPEGEYPRMKIFRGPESLSRYIGDLEGQEIAVWPFYGNPLRLTIPDEQGRRYLLLPNAAGIAESRAIPILRTPHERLEEIDFDELVNAPEFQEDGWLGDPSLTEPSSGEYYRDEGKKPPKSKKPKKKKKPDNADDDELEDV